MKTYYQELKSKRRIFHVGPTGLEIIIQSDGTKSHPRLTSQERKELDINLKIENLLSKSVDNRNDFNHLLAIPSNAGLNQLEVFSDILEGKPSPLEAKQKLLGLERYHALIWRG